ncbi:hypothetical protein [Auritidibacter ignavus]|uniref:hypothetical protein n=1 Tax=Auritidibacter ignavus TaxID=678932 RepID=UPI00109C84FE|nr:hypothetical protein [Auritidibacter ignavus]
MSTGADTSADVSSDSGDDIVDRPDSADTAQPAAHGRAFDTARARAKQLAPEIEEHRHQRRGALTLGVGDTSGAGLDVTTALRRLMGVAETLGLPDAAPTDLECVAGPPVPSTRQQAQECAELA